MFVKIDFQFSKKSKKVHLSLKLTFVRKLQTYIDESKEFTHYQIGTVSTQMYTLYKKNERV